MQIVIGQSDERGSYALRFLTPCLPRHREAPYARQRRCQMAVAFSTDDLRRSDLGKKKTPETDASWLASEQGP